MEKITTTLKGITGIGGIELLQTIPTGGIDIQELLKIIIQVAVGIITIYSMLKQKKKEDPKDENN